MVGNGWYDSKNALEYKVNAGMPDNIYEASKHSINNRAEIVHSEKCGCYHCVWIFNQTDITEWITSNNDEFPTCPRCGIDAVLGDKSGLPVTDKDFLVQMNKYWFGGIASELDLE